MKVSGMVVCKAYACSSHRAQVLTWISLYWFSRPGPAASVRIYYEATNGGDVAQDHFVRVPVGLSFFPKEVMRFPRL